MAGVTGILAFVWLVVGYFLQREELRLNTKALWNQKNALLKQTNEFKGLVKANNELIRVTARQAVASKNLVKMNEIQYKKEEKKKEELAKPIFKLLVKKRGTVFDYKIINSGGAIRNLTINSTNQFSAYIKSAIPIIKKGEFFTISYPKKHIIDTPQLFNITFTTLFGLKYAYAFEITSNHELIQTKS